MVEAVLEHGRLIQRHDSVLSALSSQLSMLAAQYADSSKNSEQISPQLHAQMAQMQQQVQQALAGLHQRFGRWEALTFWQRLRWLMTGGPR